MRLELRLNVHEAQLPDTVKALTSTEEGQPAQYTMIINDELEEDEKTIVFIHEMLHIWHSDFNNNMPASEIETLRHEETARLLRIMANEYLTSANNH